MLRLELQFFCLCFAIYIYTYVCSSSILYVLMNNKQFVLFCCIIGIFDSFHLRHFWYGWILIYYLTFSFFIVFYLFLFPFVVEKNIVGPQDSTIMYIIYIVPTQWVWDRPVKMNGYHFHDEITVIKYILINPKRDYFGWIWLN